MKLCDSATVMVTFLFCTRYHILLSMLQYCVGDKIKKNELGGACGMYGGRERCAQSFGGET